MNFLRGCIHQLLLLICIACISGCVHLHPGAGTCTEFNRIYIPPIKNNTIASNVSALFTSVISREINNQLGYHVSSAGDADVCLHIELVGYHESEYAIDPEDTSKSIAFEEQVEINCTLTSIDGKKEYFSGRRLRASAPVYVTSKYSLSRDQTMSYLANQLSAQVVELLINIW